LNWYDISENPSITFDIVKNNLDKPWHWNSMCCNKFCYNPYFQSTIYKKKLVKQFIDNCWEELIQKACHPSRILNWNDDYLEECKNGTEEEKALFIAECEKFHLKNFAEKISLRKIFE
jgi:hypothetical protein